jgi:tetratricopeptide (TPR) repeat protein
MADVFEIQEQVAEKVVEGLKLHLTSEEKQKLTERGTENAEAYELYLKAGEYFARNTKEGFELAVRLVTEAITLDPSYVQAYRLKANALTELYRNYDRDTALLDQAETLCKEALRLMPDLFALYGPLSQIYMHRGDLAKAEAAAIEFIRKDPQNYYSHFKLGFFYATTGQYIKAIAPYEEAVRLKPDHLASLWNLVVACDALGERGKCAHWAEIALPLYERYLKLHPDDESKLVHYAALLLWTDRAEAAHAAAMGLTNLRDGISLYNTACLFGLLGDKPQALRTFRKAIEAGFKLILRLKEFLTDEKEGIVTLKGTPEYEEVKRMVEAIEAEEAKK